MVGVGLCLPALVLPTCPFPVPPPACRLPPPPLYLYLPALTYTAATSPCLPCRLAVFCLPAAAQHIALPAGKRWDLALPPYMPPPVCVAIWTITPYALTLCLPNTLRLAAPPCLPTPAALPARTFVRLTCLWWLILGCWCCPNAVALILLVTTALGRAPYCRRRCLLNPLALQRPYTSALPYLPALTCHLPLAGSVAFVWCVFWWWWCGIVLRWWDGTLPSPCLAPCYPLPYLPPVGLPARFGVALTLTPACPAPPFPFPLCRTVNIC